MFAPDPWTALRLSLLVGACSLVLGLPWAVGLGYLLARGSFRGKGLVAALMIGPLVVPPVVTGWLILDLVGPRSMVGRWLDTLGYPLAFTFGGAVLAATVVGLPLWVLAARTAFASVDSRLEAVARSLGGSEFRVFRQVTLPLALPGLTAGAVLAFARAVGEFGATAVVGGNIEGHTRTLSLAIYTLLDTPEGEADLRRLVLWSLAIGGAAIAASEWLVRRAARRQGRA